MTIHHQCDNTLPLKDFQTLIILNNTDLFQVCSEDILVLEDETRKRVEGLTVYFSSCCQNTLPKNSDVQLFLKYDFVPTFF